MENMELNRNEVETGNDTAVGTVKIAEEVILTIATTAVCETEGVARIYAKGAVNPKNLIDSFKPSKGVFYAETSDGIEITVQIAVVSGQKITAVAEKVQENVIETVQSMTGIVVTRINVMINGLSDK